MRARFLKSEPRSDSIRTFYFEPEKPLDFTAGQFTELTLKHEHPDDRGERRWFTISSSPNDKLIGITTRYFGHQSSSFKQSLFGLVPGVEVKLAAAMGDFVLPKLVQTPIIFVAGGIGITPFHSMLRWQNQTSEQRPIKLIWGVRTEDDIIFQDTVDQSGIRPTVVVSQPSAAWGGERGRLNAEMIMGIDRPSEDTLIYISGPEPMVESLEKDLAKHGINRRQIVTDAFPNYPEY